MKKVILMAAASLAIFATSFAQNAATTPTEAPKMAKKSRVKPVGEAPAMQGTPAPATQAQSTPADESPKKRGEGQGMGQGGLKVLGLSAEQETKFKAINEGHKTAVKTVQMTESLAADAKKAQIELLKSKYESDVQTLLTTDQFAKWKEMRDKRGKQGSPKGSPKGNQTGEGQGEMKDAPAPANSGPAPAMKDKKNKKSN